MEFSLSEEQLALQESVSMMLKRRSPMETVRSIALDGDAFDAALWDGMSELGLPGLAIDDSSGGSGAGMVELCVVQEQLGHHLSPVPYGSTVLAGLALARHGPPESNDYLTAIAKDGMAVGLSTRLSGGKDAAQFDPDDRVVSGQLGAIVDGTNAQLALVPLTVDSGRVLAVVDLANAKRDRLDGLDLTRPIAQVEVIDAPAWVLGDSSALTDIRLMAKVLLAAEQVGAAKAALDMSVAYAGIRKQFGRPIGANQAIKHLCADMFVAVEAAWSACYYAAWAFAGAPDEFADAATVARAVAAESTRFVTGANIQVHGGIGFTWEHDAHLYVKRVRASTLLLGDPHTDLEALASSLLATS